MVAVIAAVALVALGGLYLAIQRLAPRPVEAQPGPAPTPPEQAPPLPVPPSPRFNVGDHVRVVHLGESGVVQMRSVTTGHWRYLVDYGSSIAWFDEAVLQATTAPAQPWPAVPANPPPAPPGTLPPADPGRDNPGSLPQPGQPAPSLPSNPAPNPTPAPPVTLPPGDPGRDDPGSLGFFIGDRVRVGPPVNMTGVITGFQHRSNGPHYRVDFGGWDAWFLASQLSLV